MDFLPLCEDLWGYWCASLGVFFGVGFIEEMEGLEVDDGLDWRISVIVLFGMLSASRSGLVVAFLRESIVEVLISRCTRQAMDQLLSCGLGLPCFTCVEHGAPLVVEFICQERLLGALDLSLL